MKFGRRRNERNFEMCVTISVSYKHITSFIERNLTQKSDFKTIRIFPFSLSHDLLSPDVGHRSQATKVTSSMS